MILNFIRINKGEDKKEQQQQEQAEEEAATSFVQGNDRKCYVCGSPNHLLPNCPKKKNTPRNEWYVNKAMQNMQDDNDQEVVVEEENEDDNRSTISLSNQRNDNSRENNGWSTFSSFQENMLVNKQVEEIYNK